jgi:predicted nucleic acid-binding protein
MTTPADSRIFIDTNVLTSAGVVTAPRHLSATARIQSLYQRGNDLWISRQVLREYLATLSRPQTYANALPATMLVAHVQALSARFLIAEDGPDVTAALLDLIRTIRVGGRQIHDANIVATMLAHDIKRLLTKIVTDFARYSALITIEPLV